MHVFANFLIKKYLYIYIFLIRSLTVLPVFINNVGILGAQPLRNVNQRRWNRLRRYRNRYARFNGPINNEDTLNRIACLPIQQIRNEPLINQFFNGSPFI